jgi:hypothetical protein
MPSSFCACPVAGEILLETFVSSISTFLCILNYDLVKHEKMSRRRNLCIWSTYGLVLHFIFTA